MCDCNYGFGMHERHNTGTLHFNIFHRVTHTIKGMEDLQLTQWLHFHIAVKCKACGGCEPLNLQSIKKKPGQNNYGLALLVNPVCFRKNKT